MKGPLTDGAGLTGLGGGLGRGGIGLWVCGTTGRLVVDGLGGKVGLRVEGLGGGVGLWVEGLGGGVGLWVVDVRIIWVVGLGLGVVVGWGVVVVEGVGGAGGRTSIVGGAGGPAKFS